MNRTKNQLGLTLVDILATIVILFIISMFIFNIVYSSNKQNVEQSAETVQINDAAYVMKLITKDIRKTNELGLGATETSFTFVNVNQSKQIHYIYNDADHSLSRNGGIIANQIYYFKMTNPVDGNPHLISIEFKLNGKDYETTLAFRKGNE